MRSYVIQLVIPTFFSSTRKVINVFPEASTLRRSRASAHVRGPALFRNAVVLSAAAVGSHLVTGSVTDGPTCRESHFDQKRLQHSILNHDTPKNEDGMRTVFILVSTAMDLRVPQKRKISLQGSQLLTSEGLFHAVKTLLLYKRQ
jgi:hypothetical protein